MARVDVQMTMEDILDLEKRYHQAKLALGEITYVSYYPQYPKTISDFMTSLCIDPWFGQAKYDRSKIGDIVLNIKSATLEEACCVLVGAGREERFCDGGWKSILQRDELQPVIDRLKELASA
jgi:Family of unknown function (DUF6508)